MCEEWLEEEDLRTDFKEEERIYVQMDGSMILTRETGWKEVKLGRIFGANSLLPLQTSRNYLRSSEYIHYLGGHNVFKQKMSDYIDAYEGLGKELVFINDGAKWQWNWIDSEYPSSTQILDFYHVMEHVGSYLKLGLKKESKEVQKNVIERCAKLLKEEGVDRMLEEIEAVRPLDLLPKSVKEKRLKLIGYLENNRKRIDYPSFIERGLLIGSGAIEAAHRTVIQKRMKLAGQRWSMKGARNMLNLRNINISGHWNRIVQYMARAA